MQVIEHLLILIGCCLLNLIFYKIFDIVLNQTNQSYQKLPYARKCYVVKNLTKSLFLAFFGVLFTPILYQYWFYNKYTDYEFTAYGCLYTSTDLMGLAVVPNLPLTTKLHHLAVAFLGFSAIFLVDFSQFGLSHAFVPLTYLSVIPYLVNTLLAFRFIITLPKLNLYLARVSLVIYFISILANIIAQHYYVFWLLPPHWIHYLYLLAYYGAILRDDLKLLGYLHHKSIDRTPTTPESQKEFNRVVKKALLTPPPCEVTFESSASETPSETETESEFESETSSGVKVPASATATATG